MTLLQRQNAAFPRTSLHIQAPRPAGLCQQKPIFFRNMMAGNKANWLTAMKELLRSTSPSVRGFDVLFPALSQGRRQSVDNFISRSGPTGILETSFELEEERTVQTNENSARRSHEMNSGKRTSETQRSSNFGVNVNTDNGDNVSTSNGYSNIAKVGSVNTALNSRKKLQSKSNNGMAMQAAAFHNTTRDRVSSNRQPLSRQNREIKIQEEQDSRHVRAVAAASAAAAEAAAMAAQAAAEVIRLTGYATTSHDKYSDPSLDEFSPDDFLIDSQAQRAATLIQSAYRGHLARQALRALKGLVKLQAVVRGHLVRRQARISLQCMQALVRLQARVRARQVKAALQLVTVSQDQVQGQPLSFDITSHSQLTAPPSSYHRGSPFRSEGLVQAPSLTSSLLPRLDPNVQPQFHSRAPDTSRTSSLISSEEWRDWDSSALSKEQIELKALKKQHAMMMRQRALSYAVGNQVGHKKWCTP